MGTDRNTAAFAVESLRRWWKVQGRLDYPSTDRLLVTADSGGANSADSRLFKMGLADFADECGLSITVMHFPPGTSKWNKMEHRLFSRITHSLRGQPLTSYWHGEAHMIDFTRSSIRCGLAAIALPSVLLGQAGAAHADQLPFPKQGYGSVGGPAAPGGVVDLTVKERPGNPHPTAVEVSSPALTDDTALGDTKRAWVGAGRIKKTVKPGTYPVTFTLRHKSADCVTEKDRDYVCDYPPIVLRSKVTVSGQDETAASNEGPGFGGGLAIGIASGAVATLAVGGVLLRLRRRQIPS